MIFELLPLGNLEAFTRKRRVPFTECQIRSIFVQLLRATQHMHACQFLHRDIKPENILLAAYTPDTHITIKLADLGLAKRLAGRQRPHTTYVATRWYRSPEILLQFTDYSYASDMWAIGAVMAEVVRMGDPLFPGEDERDQLAKVVALRGHPSAVGWTKGAQVMKRKHIQLPICTPALLTTKMPNASLPVLQLITDLLDMDPAKRPTAKEALLYPIFAIGVHRGLKEAEHEEVPRKKRKMHAALQDQNCAMDTSRTRDYPSSRWSRYTRVKESRKRNTAYKVGDDKVAVVGDDDDESCAFVEGTPDGSSNRIFAHQEEEEEEEEEDGDGVIFNILKEDDKQQGSGNTAGEMRRQPAGHFDLFP